jgi:RsiW-degrading membrane proteinase PrsW (M82 family)
MPLAVRCSACGKGHNAPDRAAGRTVACMACGAAMQIPQPEPPAESAYSLVSLLDDVPAIERPAAAPKAATTSPPSIQSLAQPFQPKTKSAGTSGLLATSRSSVWHRQLHWLLGLALIPLVVLLLTKSPEEASFIERLYDTVKETQPTEVAEAGDATAMPDEASSTETAETGNAAETAEADAEIDTAKWPLPPNQAEADESSEEVASLDDILALLPGERLSGAFLARSSIAHWFMAALATILYMAFFMFLATDGSAKPLEVLAVGMFTATIGVGFLLAVQFLATAFEGSIVIGFNIVTLVFYLLKLIGLSYSAAANPENGFFISFVGFTLGVGLCEECVKAFPLFWFRDTLRGSAWRGLFIWGLASGAGFGIAEGIIYSSAYYNGISGPGIYLVRFLSCVALHAIWSGSVAVFLYERRDSFDHCDDWYEWIVPSLIVIAVPAVLHGLYDTCLKKDFNGSALLVALASFAYLAFLFRRLQVDDDTAAENTTADQAMQRALARRRSVAT